MPTVTQLITYPFKSARGISLNKSGFDNEGMLNDRRLMAVDEKGIFITSRRNPTLLQVNCQRVNNGWQLSHPEQATPCLVPFANSQTTQNRLSGQVWRDKIKALDAGDEAASWISEVVGQNARVALWQSNARHSEKYDLNTSFADAAPILIASAASMKQGCDWGGVPYDIRRFRPNIVINGVEAFAEDKWTQIQIGNATFEILDRCERCILTTRDPDTGIAHPDKQPMKVLAEKHSTDAGQPLMGVNATLISGLSNTTISVGDRVVIL